MLRQIPAIALLFSAAAGVPVLARGDALAFTHVGSLYADDREGALASPEGVACTDTTLVVADTGNHRLVTYAVAGTKTTGGKETKVPLAVAPLRVQLTSKGEVLVLDGKTHRIVRLGSTGDGAVVEPSGVPGAAPVIGSFKLDATDALYALDVGTRRVLLLDANGRFTKQLDLPKDSLVTDIAVDAAGTLYAVDARTAVVWSAARGASAFQPLTKSLKDRMSFPAYITAVKGRLFVVDSNGNGIVQLGIDGTFQGRQLAIGWGDGSVNYPMQLCVNEGGIAFVADRFNNRVQLFTTPK